MINYIRACWTIGAQPFRLASIVVLDRGVKVWMMKSVANLRPMSGVQFPQQKKKKKSKQIFQSQRYIATSSICCRCLLPNKRTYMMPTVVLAST